MSIHISATPTVCPRDDLPFAEWGPKRNVSGEMQYNQKTAITAPASALNIKQYFPTSDLDFLAGTTSSLS